MGPRPLSTGSLLAGLAALPGRIFVALAIALIRIYQWTLSPLIIGACRFNPSCSRYMEASLRKHGPIRGLLRGLRRISKCHPWHPGGEDPP